MRLTSFTDYGLRALMLLAVEPERGRSAADLAAELGLSHHHLTKILQRLARAGVVATRRGGGGGAMLARPAETIRLGELVRLLEEGQPLVECFAHEGSLCTLLPGCGLKHRLRQAETAFLAELDRSTLADVAAPAIARRRALAG